jgi:hypothetical protein
MVVRHGVESVEAFMLKPFSLTALGDRVREILDSGTKKVASTPKTAALA